MWLRAAKNTFQPTFIDKNAETRSESPSEPRNRTPRRPMYAQDMARTTEYLPPIIAVVVLVLAVLAIVVSLGEARHHTKRREQEHEDALLRRADELRASGITSAEAISQLGTLLPRLNASMAEYRRQSPEPKTTDITGQINPFHDNRATYRGVGLAAFTPNANIVRRSRSQRVPTRRRES
jgi:hypothetical protein